MTRLTSHSTRRNAGGWDNPDESYEQACRLFDKNGTPILCCSCHGSAGSGIDTVRRPLIRCDNLECQQYWHLDCLDPPMANIPVRNVTKGGIPRYQPWICPRHFEHDLKNLANPAAGFRHRLRIPRNPKYRGYQNSGLIEVISNPTGVNYGPPTDDEMNQVLADRENGDIDIVRIPENVIVTRFAEAART